MKHIINVVFLYLHFKQYSLDEIPGSRTGGLGGGGGGALGPGLDDWDYH